MKLKSKILKNLGVLLFFLMMGNGIQAQSTCCGGEKHDEATCTADHASEGESTVGCAPSSCRGEQTKFGEAKVLTDLRGNLISLKAAMEKSTKITFEKSTYDIHGIVGETDDESLEIIVKEVQSLESLFSQKFSTSFSKFTLPESKAKQVAYLSDRITGLQGLL